MPPPKVNITHEEPLIVGSNTTLVCTVNYYNISDRVQMNITWLRSETVLSNEEERVAISKSSGSPSTFISQLTLSPVGVQDENISCSATAYYVVAHNPSIEIRSIETNYLIHLIIEGK